MSTPAPGRGSRLARGAMRALARGGSRLARAIAGQGRRPSTEPGRAERPRHPGHAGHAGRPRAVEAWPWSPTVTVARAILLLGPTAYLLVLAQGGPERSWLSLGVLGLALNRWPDGPLPVVCWSLLLWLWLLVGPSGPWWALLAAAVALTVHAATAFVAGAPDDAAVARPTLGRWAARWVVAMAVTALVAASSQALGALGWAGSAWLTATALVGLGAGLLVLRSAQSPGWPGPDRS